MDKIIEAAVALADSNPELAGKLLIEAYSVKGELHEAFMLLRKALNVFAGDSVDSLDRAGPLLGSVFYNIATALEELGYAREAKQAEKAYQLFPRPGGGPADKAGTYKNLQKALKPMERAKLANDPHEIVYLLSRVCAHVAAACGKAGIRIQAITVRNLAKMLANL